MSIGQLAVGTLLVTPFALLQLPSEAPSAKVVAAIAALGALGTGVAYFLYFALTRAGASRAILVTYLVPAFALGYGAVLPDEPSPRRRSAASRSSSAAPRSRPARGCAG